MAAAPRVPDRRYPAPEQSGPAAQACSGGIGLRPAAGCIVTYVFPSKPAEAGDCDQDFS
jgi:hypothetical protein